jgi:hypothetical protein
MQNRQDSSSTSVRSQNRGGRWIWRFKSPAGLGHSGDPRAWLRWGKGRGEGEGHVWLLTLGGADRKVAGGGPQRRPAAASRGGGAPVHLRRWGAAERVRLGEGMLEATSVCSGTVPRRRIGAAKRRGRRRLALLDSSGGARRRGMRRAGVRRGGAGGIHGTGRAAFIGADP